MQFLNRFLENFFKSEGDRKKLVSLVIPSFAVQAVSILIGYITSLLLARGLGAAQYGIFTFAFSIVFPLVNLVSFGIGVLVIREIPHLLTKHSPGLLKGLHNWAIKLTLPSCIILTLIVSGVTYFLPPSAYKIPVLIASAVIPFLRIDEFLLCLFKGVS